MNYSWDSSEKRNSISEKYGILAKISRKKIKLATAHGWVHYLVERTLTERKVDQLIDQNLNSSNIY